MTKVTLASLIEVGLSPRSIFNLALGVNVGSAIWVSTVGGLIMYKHLPKPYFGQIQAKLLPEYFKMVAGLSALMLGIHFKLGSSLHGSCNGCRDSTYVIRYLLGTMTLSSLINLFYVGPKTTEIMFARHKLEASEGSKSDGKDTSDNMKSLNKQFSTFHAISSGLNMFGFLVPSIFLGLWTGEYGLF
ncbi:hypothetical protein MJO28_008481 [Puccinia striiformis f. sp. tritici]|uniref:TMEM205-like domain-containing protein n=3 Tax=Puccinia striiformis TaxID=27350 RepID=A0A0L0VG38_9BASI|nr:uncharacterized protein Pst134EA_032864 [Puccinia striiformis f. sp. tritici]XP_047805206.1 hypothetical protein Pst134EA_015455 [Puccinia striiformis f. sp. tritici]KAI9610323.1 hypothetical protein KEM48_002545 [Puccinia striiformis f. sp. tritici PST-130]KNE98260.1 hypothetical protein PSTG_08534 [Puccinia striiformis f. sp. tritici PST-78]POW04564.1 hypothetical protein PSTT_10355 [Puccinia striiformis]KAH9441564.1 hypothetical protein Pst134EA_032864 [Puccinia striiformis f. sp. tritic